MSRKKQTKPRQLRRKRRLSERLFESDSTYFLKLVSVCILAAVWIKFNAPIYVGSMQVYAFPLGLLLGLLLVRIFEHHQEDRKIWYAVLIIIGIISAFVSIGIYI